MSARSRWLSGGLLVGALYVASGCNSVLGIEQAELEADATCESGQGLTLLQCTTSTACEECVGNACTQRQMSDCLADSECRKALANYRRCQRDDCTEPAGGCGGCLKGGVGAECFAECADACLGSEIFSLCEIYCSCMDRTCSGRVDPGECRTQCSMSGQPWRMNCLLTHCELALDADSEHCLHASDQLRACPDTPPAPDPTCTTKRQVGYACDDHGDCCSNSCPNGFCSLRQ